MVDITKINRNKMEALGKSLKSESIGNEELRREKEQEWIESLRQIEGVYDPETIATFETEEEAKIYPQYTRSKTMPLKSKLCQHLFPDKELNWSLNTTPIPAINQGTLDYVVQQLSQATQTPPEALTVDLIEKAIRELTAERCEKMKTVIADQLLEDKYKEKQKAALYEGIDYGTGVIKGALSKPYTSSRITKQVDPITQQTRWIQETINQYRPSCECVRIWNFFPDMSATTIDKCRFVDTLRCETKKDMLDLAERPDFFGEVINEFLLSNPRGNYRLRDWEITSLTTGTHNINNLPSSLQNQGIKSSSTPSQINNENYEVIERDCYLDGWKLYEMGITDIEDVNMTYFCNVWLLGDKIIKIALWDRELYTALDELYHLFYYDKNETSIFGKGLPKIVRYAQLGLAACDRHILRNAAWVAGPCGEVNVSLLHSSQVKDAGKVKAGKFYVKEGRGQDANAHVLQFYAIEARTNEFLAIKNEFRNQGDADSSLPSYLFGDNSLKTGETPFGTSKMIFSSMIDFIKNIVGSFDKMHESYLKSCYKWNMAFNPDESIKGDMQIETIGSAAAIINEAIVQQWAFLIQSMPDEPKDRIDWDAWLKMYGKYSGLPEYEKIVLTEEAYQQKVAQRQAEQERQIAMQEGLAQTKAIKDIQSARKTEAATAKIISEIPHNVESKGLENEMKKAQINTEKTDNIVKLSDAMKGKNEPAKE